ncbi:hypothetical protein KY290_001214 [Solanum tuberosum]|uniref:Uncharacterized protein n=1 Tax=Solanum tuberosum TaxID=4113 RepID=A0ABQ7WLK3_SOLTU|nr:hypothetical protein KY289_001343 [Solanum tuberosum]KAH0781616.1 hypothetical protein KY290_001214 [Solanum tuberosum]
MEQLKRERGVAAPSSLVGKGRGEGNGGGSSCSEPAASRDSPELLEMRDASLRLFFFERRKRMNNF